MLKKTLFSVGIKTSPPVIPGIFVSKKALSIRIKKIIKKYKDNLISISTLLTFSEIIAEGFERCSLFPKPNDGMILNIINQNK